MKLKRFNEAIEQKWTLDDIKNLSILKKEIEEKEKNITNHLNEFLYFNYTLLPSDISDDVAEEIKNGYTLDQTDTFYVDDFYFDYSISDGLVVSIKYDDGDEQKDIDLNQEQIEDFIYFMNDPEIYKNTKKYNI